LDSLEKENKLEPTHSTFNEKLTAENNIFYVHDDPVMNSVLDVLSSLGKTKKIILRAKGNSIPNAVSIANILTEKLLRGNSRIQNIKVDSEIVNNDNRMISTIEIVLLKI